MAVHNMSAPPRMTYECKPAQPPAQLDLDLDLPEERTMHVIARVSIPALLFGLLGKRWERQLAYFRNVAQSQEARRDHELRDALRLNGYWLRALSVVAQAAADGKDCAVALKRPLDPSRSMREVEDRFVQAASRLPTQQLPAFAMVRAVPTALEKVVPGQSMPALALALLARSGGPVFSVGRAPAVPTSACLDVTYEFAGYGRPLMEVL
ncbi:MAG: hypothetical protein FJ100_21415 [Deltaproteobacteria bacterium]|nr:hypothetical protein [Deltaproteobacteria bacterium]